MDIEIQTPNTLNFELGAIGGGAQEIIWFDSEHKTYADVTAALTEEKLPMAKDTYGNIYTYSFKDTQHQNEYVFVRSVPYHDLGFETFRIYVDNTISLDDIALQQQIQAGSNIQINGTTISATDTKYTAGTNVSISQSNVISATDTKYTPGTNITITNNQISAIDTKYYAGTNVSIGQDNVISATDTKYTAGNNVIITPQNVISAVDTQYTAGTGINILNGTISNSEPDKTFKATYDITYRTQITDALLANKLVYCIYNRRVYLLDSYNETSSTYYFTSVDSNFVYWIMCTGQNTWTNGSHPTSNSIYPCRIEYNGTALRGTAGKDILEALSDNKIPVFSFYRDPEKFYITKYVADTSYSPIHYTIVASSLTDNSTLGAVKLRQLTITFNGDDATEVQTTYTLDADYTTLYYMTASEKTKLDNINEVTGLYSASNNWTSLTIGGVTKNIPDTVNAYKATYNTDTYTAVKQAYDANKIVYCEYNNKVYYLANETSESIKFSCIDSNYVYWLSVESSDNAWSNWSTTIDNSVSIISLTYDAEQFKYIGPTKQQLLDIINANKVIVFSINVVSGGSTDTNFKKYYSYKVEAGNRSIDVQAIHISSISSNGWMYCEWIEAYWSSTTSEPNEVTYYVDNSFRTLNFVSQEEKLKIADLNIVTGTNDGTNWSTITIGNVTKSIPTTSTSYIFIADYNTSTPFSDVLAAYNANKLVICKYKTGQSKKYLHLREVLLDSNNSPITFTFSVLEGNVNREIALDITNGWSHTFKVLSPQMFAGSGISLSGTDSDTINTIVTVPTVPTSGNYVLKSANGVLSWVAES